MNKYKKIGVKVGSVWKVSGIELWDTGYEVRNTNYEIGTLRKRLGFIKKQNSIPMVYCSSFYLSL
jgi:hypothetical protein